MPLLYIFIILSFIGVLTFTARWLLRRINNRVWESKTIEVSAVALPYVAYIFLGLFALGWHFKIPLLTPIASITVYFLTLLSLLFIVTLPFSLTVDWINRMVLKFTKKENNSFSPLSVQGRRKFLKAATAAMPVLVLGGVGKGFAGGFQPVRIPEVTMHFKDLPGDLQGLRILHLSDLHLGYYFQLSDLEELLDELSSKEFELVLVTGDVADDLTQLSDALKLIDQLNAPLPKFVSLGNHEYFRGIKEVLRKMEASPVHLLRNNGHHLKIGETKIYVGGADDPVRMHTDISAFMSETVNQAMSDANGDAFKILLSHRPRALDVAGPAGIDLILAGHTHGGQLGYQGKSIFEEYMKNRYLWGTYSKGETKLYTSSGVGHWMPFRLGCPPEAPIITLEKG
ncbi:MAG TPA: metallophosphoesterase [Calditrichaeota bacterium]|nr:metallophosphoesterase [Calditrichota bacterium]